MNRQRQSLHISVAALYRDFVPKALELIERAHHDVGQAVVWLVGLASTLLVLAVANPEKLQALAPRHYALLSGLLLATVVSGVASRLVALLAIAYGRGVLFGLSAQLAGYVEGWSLEPPDDVSDTWTSAEIVERIARFSGADYGWLLEHNVSLEGCRRAYTGAHELWVRQESESLGRLQQVLGAHFGFNEEKSARLFDATDLAAARRKARLSQGLALVSGILLVVSAMAFVAAMSLVAAGLTRLAA